MTRKKRRKLNLYTESIKMIKKHIYKTLFCGSLLLGNSLWAADATPVNPTGVAGAAQQVNSDMNKLKTCADYNANITHFCSNNSTLAQAQVESGQVAAMNQSMQNGGHTNNEQLVNTSIGQTQMTQQAYREILKTCKQANTRCGQICDNEYSQAASQNPPDVGTMNNSKAGKDRCDQELDRLESQVKTAQMSLNEVLQSLMMLKSLLGMGGDASSASLAGDDDEDDKCKGEFADILLECTGQSDPNGTRAGLGGSGLAGLNGNPNSNGLFNTSGQGEPGGESKGNPSNSGGAGSGGGMGAFGSAGMGMGTGSGSTAATEAGGEALNAEINRGFMATGGGGSGGGGGGYAAAASRPMGPGVILGGDAAAQKAALNQKLSKAAQGSAARGLASDGTNGPLQDIWSVVNKSYRKNSQTLYHQ